MPNIDPNDTDAVQAHQRALARSQRLAEQRGWTPTPTPLSRGQFEERCAVRAEPNGDDPVLRAGHGVRCDSATVAAQIQSDVRQILADPTRNEAARTVDAGSLAIEAGERHLRKIDEAIALVERRISEAKDEVESLMHPADKRTDDLMPEVRAVLRSMTEEQRTDVLTNMESDDFRAAMYAVASAPAFMSGVHPAKRQELRSLVLGIRRPVLLTLPAQFAKERELLEQCRKGFKWCVDDVANVDAVNAIKSLRGDA